MLPQRLIVLHIGKESDLIKLMMNQGTPICHLRITVQCPYFLLYISNVVKLLHNYFDSMSLLLSFSYSSLGAYGQSKLANILHANELTKHLKVGFFVIINSSLFICSYMHIGLHCDE